MANNKNKYFSFCTQLALDIRSLHETLVRFKAIHVDPAEFACLKAIVLFRSDAKGLKSPSEIENLQDQAQVCCSFSSKIKLIFLLGDQK